MSSPQEIARLYNLAAEAYDAGHQAPSMHVNDFLMLLPSGGNILEIGSGPGVDAHYFQQRNFPVIAMDISPEMVAHAKAKYPGVDFRVGDMRELSFPPESFDGIYVEFALIHIPKSEAEGVVRQFHQLLKPGGILELGLQEGVSQEVVRETPFYPGETIFLNVMSQQESQGLLERTGFSVVQTFQHDPKPGQHPFIKRVTLARKIG